MTDQPLPTIMQMTPLDPTYRDDPYSVLKDLQARCPVHRDDVAGNFILSRYSDIRPLVSDRTLWRDPLLAEPSAVMSRRFADVAPEGVPRSEATSILTLDDPDHARIRQPLAQALYARVARFRPQVEQIIDATLDAIDTSGPFDLMSQFCVPVPIDAIAAILGVDHGRLVEFRDWSEGAIQGLNPFRNAEQTAHMERSSLALREYFLSTIAERRASPRDDLISDMARLQNEGLAVSDVELQINLGALLVGGNLTTTDLIGNGIRLLLLNPDQMERLRTDPTLINSTVEEILRFDPPVDSTSRVASRDIEVAGCPIKQSQALIFQLRAANRDPEAFEDPDRFDIARKGKPHMAFGGGAHICIGSPLARLEAQVAILKLVQRFPELKLANPDEAPQWRRLPFFRGLEKLELRA
jgi:cytochrome P450